MAEKFTSNFFINNFNSIANVKHNGRRSFTCILLDSFLLNAYK